MSREAKMPKVRVQSQICYPLSMPTYTVNVFNEIVPEMSVEVQYNITVAKWMHVLLDWRRGRGSPAQPYWFGSWVSTDL